MAQPTSATASERQRKSPQLSSSPKAASGAKINIFEITTILKGLGFRLDFLDYVDDEREWIQDKSSNAAPDDITIDIKCAKARIRSRLSAPREACVCPVKNDTTASGSAFWEVQGTAPASSQNITDTSSSLLPNLSSTGSEAIKHLLSVILEVFKSDRQPRSGASQFNSPLIVNGGTPSSSAPAGGDVRIRQLENVLNVPPNTPKEPHAQMDQNNNNNNNNLDTMMERSTSVLQEMTAARKSIDNAILLLKLKYVGVDNYTLPIPLDLSSKSEEDLVTTTQRVPDRRKSIGPPSAVRAKVDTGVRSGSVRPLIRHKSSVEPMATLRNGRQKADRSSASASGTRSPLLRTGTNKLLTTKSSITSTKK